MLQWENERYNLIFRPSGTKPGVVASTERAENVWSGQTRYSAKPGKGKFSQRPKAKAQAKFSDDRVGVSAGHGRCSPHTGGVWPLTVPDAEHLGKVASFLEMKGSEWEVWQSEEPDNGSLWPTVPSTGCEDKFFFSVLF